MERKACDGRGGFLLRFEHGEGQTRGFAAEPFGDEIGEARFFELQISWRHALARAQGHARLGDAAHMALDEGRKVCQREEFPMGANASRRTCPDGEKNFMKKRAAFEGGEAGFGGVPRSARRDERRQKP